MIVRYIRSEREVYKERAYAAPSMPGGVEATPHLRFVPSPFKAAEWKGSGAKDKAPQKKCIPNVSVAIMKCGQRMQVVLGGR